MFKLQQEGSPFFPKSVCVRMCPCEDGDGLVAATSSDHHVAVFLENDVRAVVEVEHRDGIELRGGTAGFRNCLWVNEMNKCLHNGMVCGVHVGVQREGTLSLAIVCCISFWSNDPVLPPQVSETDVELMLLACLLLISTAVFCNIGHSKRLLAFCPFRAVGVTLFAPSCS